MGPGESSYFKFLRPDYPLAYQQAPFFFFLLKSVVEPLAMFFSFQLLYFSTPKFLLWVLFTISVYLHFVLSLITERSISIYRYLIHYFRKSGRKTPLELLTLTVHLKKSDYKTKL